MKRIIIFSITLILAIICVALLKIDFTVERIMFLLCAIVLFMLSMAFFYSYITMGKDTKIKWLENRLEVWNNISYHVKRAGDEAFNELPVGIILYDEDYEIKWANRYAKTIFQNKLVERALSAIHSELYSQINDDKETINIAVYENKYDVIIKKEYRLLYLFDVTKREEITKRYQERITALGVIYLDNIEESLGRYDVQEKSKIRGRYLGEISDWVFRFGSYLKSFDDNRLIMILDYKQLSSMMEERFDILNKIRDISKENELRVTVSIGIACWDVGYEELGGLAQNAIELAEKRGGDQVVVNIQNEKIRYFGGKTNALEKNSKVLVRIMTQTLKDLIEESSNIIVMGHINTDVDSFGGMIGITKMAMTCKKPVYLLLTEQMADLTVGKFLKQIAKEHVSLNECIIDTEHAKKIINGETLLVIVDTQSPNIVSSSEIYNLVKRRAIIDHHRRGDVTFEDTVFNYIEPYASSSVELIAEMFPFFGKKVDVTPYEATLMLAGIVVDTNDFTFRTGSRTFDVASILREYGADTIRVKTMLRDSLKRHLTISGLIGRVEVLYEKYAIVKAPDDEVLDRVMLAEISEELLQIDDMSAAFTIGYVEEGLAGISARSYADVNVQIMMEELGGGGHLNSAATQLPGATLDEAYVALTSILEKEYLQEGEEKMKIILTADVKGRGAKNDIIDVANGYGNFLITANKAIVATDENIRLLNENLEKVKTDAENHLKLMLKLKEEIENKSVNIYIKMGEDGKMFGSVTTKQIAEEFEAQFNIHIDKRKIVLPGDINSLGIYEAEVQLHHDVTAKIEVHVLEK